MSRCDQGGGGPPGSAPPVASVWATVREHRYKVDPPISSGRMTHPPPLSDRSFRKAISELAARDQDLAHILTAWGQPPFWTHPPGFPGIVLDILAQQVSLESAAAAFAKLESAVASITPEHLLALGDQTLKEVGFSRQKAAYVRSIAGGILDGRVLLDAVASLDDEEARRALHQLKGVGPWTADCYLLFSLRRADAWPTGDLALIKAVEEVKALPSPLTARDADAIAESWKPWRAVAARMLWHHYLSSRDRTPAAGASRPFDERSTVSSAR